MTEEEIQQTLIALQNGTTKERGTLIKQIEGQGRQVDIDHLVYVIIDEGEQHRLPEQTCPQCHTAKILSDFFARKHVLPWCKTCRELDPVEAKRAADREYQRRYPKEKRRAKEQRQKEKHPLRKDYSDAQLDQIACDLACTILEEQALTYVEQEQERYTPTQRRKILERLLGIQLHIVQIPQEQRQEAQRSDQLRTITKQLLQLADGLLPPS